MDHAETRTASRAAFALGFALGGFFDGILLHQILQWHHLLSLVPGSAFQNLRTQVLADGAFHVAMLGVASIGFWLLWRGRHGLASPGAGRQIAATALLGFGTWHLLDAVLSHWLLGLHRIRVDVPNPLPWDLAWAGLFGLLPLLAGWALRRRGGGGPGGAVAATLGLAVLAGGPASLLPAAGSDRVAVLFPAGTTAELVLRAATAVEARLVSADASGTVWVMQLASPGRAWRLYGEGALLVGGAGLPGGCLSWVRG